MIQGIPLPATDDPLDSEFWAHARTGHLVIQCCDDCGEMRFPPRPMCPSCQSDKTGWKKDDGRAVVWSFARPSPPLLPAFEALLPYFVVIGALRSNPAIRIAGMATFGNEGEASMIPGPRLEIGQPICMRFRAMNEHCSLPIWNIEPWPDRDIGREQRLEKLT